MRVQKLPLFSLGFLIVFLSSCATRKIPETPITKPEPEYKNPFKPGTYEHFTAEKNYPKTHNIWTNEQLLETTNPSNSWIRIDLETQRGFLMNRKQIVIDYPISSGTETHPTPAGKYKILEKVIDKSSNKYGRIYDAEGNLVNGDANAFDDKVPEGGKFEGAPMKYWMRLTWGGIGHHIGVVPRYPASHGCIRGPKAIMPIVFSKVDLGTKVILE